MYLHLRTFSLRIICLLVFPCRFFFGRLPARLLSLAAQHIFVVKMLFIASEFLLECEGFFQLSVMCKGSPLLLCRSTDVSTISSRRFELLHKRLFEEKKYKNHSYAFQFARTSCCHCFPRKVSVLHF